MDYAAGAPLLPVVQREMRQAERLFANPSSIHKDGVLARQALEGARKAIADVLHALPDEIVFTGSGTEANNLAIMGVFKHARLSPEFAGKDLHIITTAIEHSAVLETCWHLEKVGAQVTYLPVDEQGLIDLKELRSALRPETILVSIGYANNEIGAIQPIKEIAKEIRHYKKYAAESTKTKGNLYPLFHTDACQAVAYLNCNMEQLGVDLFSWNGTKLGGPHGIGALYVSRNVPIDPMQYGGGQERGLRSGTENIAGSVGMAAALTEAENIKEKEVPFLQILQSYFISEVKSTFPEARINGSQEFRLPNNVHVSFPNISSELLVLELDAKGISASAGSACDSAKDISSHVLEALYGKEDAEKWGSVRFSFGRGTTKRQIAFVLKSLKQIFEKYK